MRMSVCSGFISGLMQLHFKKVQFIYPKKKGQPVALSTGHGLPVQGVKRSLERSNDN
jgi:hypothetical protein